MSTRQPIPAIMRLGPRKLIAAPVALAVVIAVWLLTDEPGIALVAAVLLGGFALTGFGLMQLRRTLLRAIAQLPTTSPPVVVAPAPQPEPDAPAAKAPKTPRASLGIRALWGGFSDSAVAHLDKLTMARGATASERSQAALALGKWHYLHGPEERALFYAQLSRVAWTDAPWRSTQARLEADLLRMIGSPLASRRLIDNLLEEEPGDPDLLLRKVNSYAYEGRTDFAGMDRTRLALLNQLYLAQGLAPLELVDAEAHLRLDNIAAPIAAPGSVDGPLVSVLIPAYNAEDWLANAIRSVLNQTWGNLEVIVVDDASTDGTAQVAEEVAASDSRVTVLRQPHNAGAYAARNRAAEVAHGEWLIVNDSDDWAHPERIALQVAGLTKNTRLVAALSQRSRVADDLLFVDPTLRYRDERVVPDLSSLLVPRRVLEQVGLWDDVRAAGDSEMLRRLRRRFGDGAVRTVQRGAPLSLSLRLPSSISSQGPTSMLSNAHVIGARKLYLQAADHWHASSGFSGALPYKAGGVPRPFPAPAALRGDGSLEHGMADVVQMSNYNLPGGTTASNIQEMAAQRRAGLTTALVHNPIFEWKADRGINPKVWDEIDGRDVRVLTADESVETDLLVLRHPKVAEHLVDGLPQIHAAHTVIIVNQTPFKSYAPGGQQTYDLAAAARNIVRRFGPDTVWCPIGPLVRTALHEHHADVVADLNLADEDWVNIIDMDAWRREHRPIHGDMIRIGRHSRDSNDKWQREAANLRASYPDAPDIEIHVLGGATVPGKVLGQVPSNWTVHEFDSLPVRDYLHGLDVYAYFTAETYVEAFGRTLLEALAVGLPVITSDDFAPLLGPAAIYARPHEVLDIARELRDDPERYARQVELAWKIVEDRFSYAAHLRRIAAVRGADAVASPGDGAFERA